MKKIKLEFPISEQGLTDQSAQLSVSNSMLSSSHALSLLYVQSVQQQQNSANVELSNTAKCIVEILNQGKTDEIISKVVGALS